MKLRWPFYKDTCWECDHTALRWRTPWYRPYTPTEKQRIISELWVRESTSSLEAILKLPPSTVEYAPPEFGATITIPSIKNARLHDS